MTIYEAILNAEYNLTNNGKVGAMLAQDQLINIVAELKTGKDLNDEILGEEE